MNEMKQVTHSLRRHTTCPYYEMESSSETMNKTMDVVNYG